MRRIKDFGNGRHLVGDDLSAIQEQITHLEAMYASLIGPFVISGCGVTAVSGSLYNIAEGLIYLNRRVVYLPAQTNVSISSGAYLCADSMLDEAVRPYADLGSSAPGIEKDVLKIVTGAGVIPGENLAILSTGMRTLAEAIRDMTIEPKTVQMYAGPLSGKFAANGDGIGSLRGWALADGQFGRIDLRDRFIVGSGAEYLTGDTGGVKEVTLTAAQSGLKSHTHPRNYQGGQTVQSGTGVSVTLLGAQTETTPSNSSEDADEAHTNLPPYFALAYMIYVGTQNSNYYIIQ